MVKSQSANKSLPHEDSATFRSCLEYTARVTGFTSRLIEKDYFCSLILRALYEDASQAVVFKGGTLLNKVYGEFYRLSEDLDFSISIAPNAPRSQRSRAAKPLKTLPPQICEKITGLHIKEGMKGSNNSSQYNAVFEYSSGLSDQLETISFEIALREEIIVPPNKAMAFTVVQDPLRQTKLIQPFEVICLTAREAYAEKVRAAFTRKDPAIRDLFDTHVAVQKKEINPQDKSFTELIRRKLLIAEKGSFDLSEAKKKLLQDQLESQLQPVLRPSDFAKFDFQEAWKTLLLLKEGFRR